MTSTHHLDPAALAAMELRARLRSLAAAQAAAFDMLYHHCGGNSSAGTQINRSTDRLAHLVALLADLAWVHGEHEVYEAPLPPPAPEAAAVKHLHQDLAKLGHRRHLMTSDQRVAVLNYLDALLVTVSSCIDLDEHAPSPTLARKARGFVADFTEVRNMAAAL
jgi:hypothetical protein